MSSLGTKFTSKHLNSSQDTSPYRFTLKFAVNFANLTRRDPHLENIKFKMCGATALNLICTQCSNISRAVGLERAWERKGRRFVSRIPFLSRKKKKKGVLLFQLRFALCLAALCLLLLGALSLRAASRAQFKPPPP